MVPATSHSRNFVVCVDLNEDQKHDDDDDPFFSENHQVEAVSSFSSLSHPHPFKPPDQGSSYSWGEQPPKHLPSDHHEKAEKIIIRSRGHGSLLSRGHYSAADHQDGSSSSSSSSVKWLPSKKRILIRNMTMDQKASAGSSYIAEGKGNYSVDKYYFEDQQQPFSSSAPPLIAATVTVRVCSDCQTTKTPLWRSGPSGPKSLCNACGIRQRKARRAAAMAAAAEANGGGTMINNPVAAETVKGGNKSNNKKSKMEQLKKKRKLIGVASKQPTQGDNNGRKNKLGFEDLKLMSFPQDEIEIKEAAILLMALSCGHLVVHG